MPSGLPLMDIGHSGNIPIRMLRAEDLDDTNRLERRCVLPLNLGVKQLVFVDVRKRGQTSPGG
jgi:hypothetical protein